MNSLSKTKFNVVRLVIFTAVLMVAGVHSAFAQANTPDQAVAKMTIIGIGGDSADGSIEVVGINQLVTNPPPVSGANTPPSFSVTITKKIDRATPRLLLSAMTGETLAQVRITWTKLNSSRYEEGFSHIITLKGVLVTMVRQRPADGTNPEARFSDEYEDVTFATSTNTTVEWDYALSGGRTIIRTGWDFGRWIPK